MRHSQNQEINPPKQNRNTNRMSLSSLFPCLFKLRIRNVLTNLPFYVKNLCMQFVYIQRHIPKLQNLRPLDFQRWVSIHFSPHDAKQHSPFNQVPPCLSPASCVQIIVIYCPLRRARISPRECVNISWRVADIGFGAADYTVIRSFLRMTKFIDILAF